VVFNLIGKKSKSELLYIWYNPEMLLAMSGIVSVENHKEEIKLSKQFNATSVFEVMKMKCVFTEENVIPV
jgi:hypothetical protein